MGLFFIIRWHKLQIFIQSNHPVDEGFSYQFISAGNLDRIRGLDHGEQIAIELLRIFIIVAEGDVIDIHPDGEIAPFLVDPVIFMNAVEASQRIDPVPCFSGNVVIVVGCREPPEGKDGRLGVDQQKFAVKFSNGCKFLA